MASPRVILVLPHLGVGGAQRVAVTLANYWAAQGVDLHVVTTMEDKDDFYELDLAVKRHTVYRYPPRLPDARATSRKQAVSGAGKTHDAAKKSPREHGPVGRLLVAAIVATLTPVVRLRTEVPRFLMSHRVFGDNPKPYLGIMRVAFWRVRRLRALLRQLDPDVVVAFLGATNIMSIAATRGMATRLLISERNDPSRQALNQPWQALRPLIYPLADIVTANSHGALDAMQSYCGTGKLAYVPNPLVIPSEEQGGGAKSIIFLARLVHQKAPDVLIEAFARFAEKHPEWTLELTGDGPMEDELRSRVSVLGIAERVTFHGLVKEPTELLMNSSIFVLPSRFEGTPNALLEAMASGLACIVSDASPGPLKLIQHGVSGLVVRTDDIDDLAEAFTALAADADLRSRLSRSAFERTEEFRLENVARDWENLFFQRKVGATLPDDRLAEAG
jgi:glycosyltransferase involved in cell wall biosynthesis